MSKFKVSSGEFEVIVHETSLKKAGDLAIKLHNDSNHPSSLGELTLVEKLNRNNQMIDHSFIMTQQLIDDNITDGNYCRIDS